MTSLTARLKVVSDGTRPLSDEVLLAMGWTEHFDEQYPGRKSRFMLAPTGKKKYRDYYRKPDPARNLADVVALVPKGREWSVERRYSRGMRPAYASIWSAGARDTDFHANGDAATPELAFCIALLDAKEQSK